MTRSMKLRSVHLVLLGCYLLSSTLSAQSDSVGHIPRHNVIKLGMTSSLVNVLSINYERVLNPDLSVALTVSYMLPITPSGLFNPESENISFGADRKLTGLYFTPEVKWYLERSDKRPAPRGLYVGAYLRYSDTRYTASLSAIATGENAGGTITTELRIDLIEYGIGPSMGYQFLMFKDRLAVDAIFFAPRWVMYKVKVEADLQGDGELYSALGQAIEEKLGHELLDTDIELSTTGSTTVDRNSLGYRYGIKFGYAF